MEEVQGRNKRIRKDGIEKVKVGNTIFKKNALTFFCKDFCETKFKQVRKLLMRDQRLAEDKA